MSNRLLAVAPVVACAFAGSAYFAWRGFWPMVVLGLAGGVGWLWVAVRDA